MNIKKVKEIIKFDVEKSIQNKWFVILNIILFIGVLIATNWSNLSNYLEEHNINFLSQDDITIQVLDNENLVYDSLVNKYKDEKHIKFERVTENSYSKDNIPDDNVILFEISRDSEKVVKSKVVSKEGTDDYTYSIFEEAVNETRTKVFADNNGIEVKDLNILSDEPEIDRILLGVDAENSDTKEMIKLISVVVVYMALIIVLSRIANEIAQEKVSKSIEYVLTSVSAKEYLIAKVLSSTITVVIQIMYGMVYYMIGNLISNLFVMNIVGSGFSGTFANVDFSIVKYVLVMALYLIFTVFLTTLIQAALSAKTTSVSEAGNTMMILMFVIVSLYFISLSAISPYITVTPFMYVVSCLPIVSTFFVPSMMIIGQATTIQIVISFIVLIVTVPLIFNICANHFKNGILDYTSKKKKGFLLKREKKEISLKEKQEYDLRVAKAKKFAFTIGLAILILIVLQVVLSLLLASIIPNIIDEKLDVGSVLLIENSIIIVVALGLTSAFINFYSNDIHESEKKLTNREKFEIIFTGIGLIAIIQLGLNFIYEKIGLDYNILESYEIIPGGKIIDKIIYVLGLTVIPAMFEELLYRRTILNYSRRFGNLFAVVFSSLLFGLIHMNLGQGIFAFLIGLVLGVIAIKTSSIKLTVLLHFINNLYATLSVLLEEGSVFYGIFDVLVIAIVVVGIITLIKNLPKLKKINKKDFKINKDCIMLLRNYTFIVAMVLIIVMFWVTEKSLSF